LLKIHRWIITNAAPLTLLLIIFGWLVRSVRPNQ